MIEVGAISLTSRVIVTESLPPVLVAVIVYVVSGESAVGVPEISPVAVSKTRPVGRSGEIDHESTAPPAAVGVSADIGTPLVRVNGSPL